LGDAPRLRRVPSHTSVELASDATPCVVIGTAILHPIVVIGCMKISVPCQNILVCIQKFLQVQVEALLFWIHRYIRLIFPRLELLSDLFYVFNVNIRILMLIAVCDNLVYVLYVPDIHYRLLVLNLENLLILRVSITSLGLHFIQPDQIFRKNHQKLLCELFLFCSCPHRVTILEQEEHG
jgi:hypothetical protein